MSFVVAGQGLSFIVVVMELASSPTAIGPKVKLLERGGSPSSRTEVGHARHFFGTEFVSEKIRRAPGHGPETAARFSAPILGPTSFNYVGMGSKSCSTIWAHHPCPFFFIFAKFFFGFRQAFEVLSLTPPACRCEVLLGFFLVARGVQFCKAAGGFGTEKLFC